VAVGILLITHPGVGSTLLQTATTIMGVCPLQTKCLDIPPDAPTKPLLAEAQRHLATLDTGNNVLVMTDIYGGTPSNIAKILTDAGEAGLVTGINLPMLIRVFNYPGDDLDELCHKATEGGIRGIYSFPPQQPLNVLESAG